MIRDEFLKRFIVFQYNKHIDKDMKTISFLIHKSLSRKFLRNEKVRLIKESRYGNIINRHNKKYTIHMDNDTFIENVNPGDIRRLEPINPECIFNYLMFITVHTCFNVRLLKKDVFDDIFKTRNYNMNMTCESKNDPIKSDIKHSKEEIIRKIECNEDIKLLEISDKSIKVPEKNLIDLSKIKQPEDNKLNKMSQEQLRKLNINILSNITVHEKYSIENQDFQKTQKILKIFAFIKNFCGEFVPSDFNIQKLVRSLKESAYNGDAIGNVHEFLIDNLNEELEKYGILHLLNNLKSVIDSLPEDDTIGEAAKKNDIGLKTWKVKTRAFLWDLQSRTNNKIIYSFYVMLSKKKTARITEAFNVRLDLLEFLISSYFTTKIFRDVLLNELRILENLEIKVNELEKNIQNEEDNLKNNKDEKIIQKIQVKINRMRNELNKIKSAIVYNPTKSDIGTINHVKFMFIDNVIYASKRNKFYVLSRKNLENIAEFYIPTDRMESVVLKNLKNVIEAIYK
jgi:hypothetical protein